MPTTYQQSHYSLNSLLNLSHTILSHISYLSLSHFSISQRHTQTPLSLYLSISQSLPLPLPLRLPISITLYAITLSRLYLSLSLSLSLSLKSLSHLTQSLSTLSRSYLYSQSSPSLSPFTPILCISLSLSFRSGGHRYNFSVLVYGNSARCGAHSQRVAAPTRGPVSNASTSVPSLVSAEPPSAETQPRKLARDSRDPRSLSKTPEGSDHAP